jgi:hypothetical protein
LVAELIPRPTRGRTGREKLLPTIIALLERVESLESKLDQALAQRPVVEWKPNHRRHKDGGTHVNAQRREKGIRR